MENIRLARLEDAPAVARVHISSWRSTYKGIVAGQFLANLSVERSKQRWDESLRGGAESGAFLYVAETGREGIVGFASGGPNRHGEFPVYGGELYAIYLLQSAQRRGIGRALVGTVARRLLDLGHKNMLVWVLTQNPSACFYRALGGQFLCEKNIEIGGQSLPESAYVWNDLQGLVNQLYG